MTDQPKRKMSAGQQVLMAFAIVIGTVATVCLLGILALYVACMGGTTW